MEGNKSNVRETGICARIGARSSVVYNVTSVVEYNFITSDCLICFSDLYKSHAYL